MKKLLSIFGSLGMAGITGASVVACGDPKETKTTPKEDLNKRIKEVEDAKTQIEKNDNWGGIVESVKNKLEESITKAKEISEKPEATKDEIDASIQELNEGIASFELSLPENIIKEVINGQKDIKDLVDKNWTYSEFWNLDGEASGDRIMDIFYGAIQKKSEELGYSSEDASKLHDEIFSWSQKNVNLVYINVKDGEQVVKKTFSRKGNEEKTMNEIFLEEVRDDFKDLEFDENGNTSEDGFWEKDGRGEKLSLGISFDAKDEGHTLPETTKEFWTFTFINE